MPETPRAAWIANNSLASDSAPESFHGLLLRHRGRIGLTQRQLAARIGVSARTVQDWEAGVNHASAERLQALIGVYATMGGFAAGREADEADALWTAATRESARLRTPFDHSWFADLLRARAGETNQDEVAREGASVVTRDNAADTLIVRDQDWGDAPDTVEFVGRAAELSALEKWVTEERCRLVALLGLGGIGKTTLAARSAEELTPDFELVYWRNLRSMPSFRDWLTGAVGFLSRQKQRMPADEAEACLVLLQLLRERRCLLVLDNFEMLLEPDPRVPGYPDGHAGFGTLLRLIADSRHQSCLVLTSRETPPEMELLACSAVHSLELGGLAVPECQALLRDKQLTGSADAWTTLVERFGGNGLALKIVGETIQQLFGGDIANFLEGAGPCAIMGGLRRLLESHFNRLSQVEQEILTWLAVHREPVSLTVLASAMAPRVRPARLLEAVETLRRRSLLERGERPATFILPSMVLEYLSTRLLPGNPYGLGTSLAAG